MNKILTIADTFIEGVLLVGCMPSSFILIAIVGISRSGVGCDEIDNSIMVQRYMYDRANIRDSTGNGYELLWFTTNAVTDERHTHITKWDREKSYKRVINLTHSVQTIISYKLIGLIFASIGKKINNEKDNHHINSTRYDNNGNNGAEPYDHHTRPNSVGYAQPCTRRSEHPHIMMTSNAYFSSDGKARHYIETFDTEVMENFFGIMKSELLYLHEFDSMKQFKQELVKYIYYYNNHRIKLRLKGKSPVKYRALCA